MKIEYDEICYILTIITRFEALSYEDGIQTFCFKNLKDAQNFLKKDIKKFEEYINGEVDFKNDNKAEFIMYGCDYKCTWIITKQHRRTTDQRENLKCNIRWYKKGGK